jgi:hypothetical protein
MRFWAVGALILLSQANAQADVDARRAIPQDVVAAIAVRPVGVSGALRRIGSGWETIVRRGLRIPQAVAPLEPGVIAALGIDPAATAWAAVRGLRTGTHVRVALPLENERIAEALVQTAASVLGITMTRTLEGAWHSKTIGKGPVVVRLDGTLLVADALVGSERPVSSPELQRLVPLRPPRAFAIDRGAARRIGPATTLAIWLDLPGLVQLALAQAERGLKQALAGVDASMRSTLMHKGNEEIGNCRAAARTLPPTFEDLLFAVAIKGPD